MSFNLQMNLCKTLAVCIALLAAPGPAGTREFRVVLPRFKRRIEAEVSQLPAWQLKSEPQSDAAP